MKHPNKRKNIDGGDVWTDAEEKLIDRINVEIGITKRSPKEKQKGDTERSMPMKDLSKRGNSGKSKK